MSIITDDPGTAIAARIRRERDTRDWSLGNLADRARVSKAMLSKIERAEASPTAVVLSKIATAFGLTLAALVASAEPPEPRVLRIKGQPVWRDPKTSYSRRQIFLSGSNPLELVEIELPAGEAISFPASAYRLIKQVVWVLRGRLTVIEGRERHELGAGDRLEFGAPADTALRNDGAQPCRYLVAIVRL
jgi:transcriptional regulator with XRE-family HTH domain